MENVLGLKQHRQNVGKTLSSERSAFHLTVKMEHRNSNHMSNIYMIPKGCYTTQSGIHFKQTSKELEACWYCSHFLLCILN